MNWLDRMNDAINYIEENITENIDYEEVAKIACCSVYHFQRMFSFILDVPISEYIRRRRLTLAAFELQNSDIKIIDLALKYRYDSPISFTRAFQNVHGITPSSARSKGSLLKAYPRISFHITIKGDVEMNYKIEENGVFKLFGKSIQTSQVDGKCFKDITKFWQKCHADGTYEKISNLAGYPPRKQINSKQIGSVTFGHRPDGTFTYMIAASLPDNLNVDDFEILEIEAMTWAIFSTACSYNEALSPIMQNIWKRLPEWFETSAYEYSNAPALENFTFSETQKCGELWIPITTKSYIK